MKVSYNWLQDYIDGKMPDAKGLDALLTFHSFQVEGIEKIGDDSVIDIDILPNRAHDCLCHLGIAKEISLLAGLKMKQEKTAQTFPISKELEVTIGDPKVCRRYIGAVMKGVKVGPSPDRLKKRLESIGQRSINNIVDATNYVLFSVGQPLHAFDMAKLGEKEGKRYIVVKKISAPEDMIALDMKTYKLSAETLVITDGVSDTSLAIAGIKGGAAAAISDSTTDILLESANFDPIAVRKTARGLGLQTDASKRFENEITPEKAFLGMSELISLIKQVAGGELEGVVDIYPRSQPTYRVGVSLSEVNDLLGVTLSDADIRSILEKCGLDFHTVIPQGKIVSLAESLAGRPYKYASSVLYDAPNSFDCSCFTSYLHVEAGIAIPRMAVDQYVWSDRIEGEPQAGDLVFANTGHAIRKIDHKSIEFLKGTDVPAGVDHVGLCLGNGKVVHATDDAGKVIVEDLASSEQFKNITGYGRTIKNNEERYVVSVPADRLDIRIKEDLIEEIGRVYGYEHISGKTPEKDEVRLLSKELYYSALIRQILVGNGFSEIYTYSFKDEGEISVANPLASDKGFLRKDLSAAMAKALEFNLKNAELLGLDQIKAFEIGKIFTKEREYTSLCIGIANTKGFKNTALPKDEQSVNGEIRAVREMLLEKLGADVQIMCTIDDTGGLLTSNNKQVGIINNLDGIMEIDLERFVELALPALTTALSFPMSPVVKFQPISAFPFIVRDIAVFVPGEKGREDEVLKIIHEEGTGLLVRTRLFDTFTKKTDDASTKTSYAFRLVFQSDSRTLTDEEANTIMNRMTEKMNANQGWQVR